MPFKIYKIYPTNYTFGYDTFDSAIVIADSTKEASNIHPCTGKPLNKNNTSNYGWPTSLDQITVEHIGYSTATHPGVILASYNAGK